MMRMKMKIDSISYCYGNLIKNIIKIEDQFLIIITYNFIIDSKL